MSKFHINKHGVPARCRAKKGNCPLGGQDGNQNHFDTIEEAQVAVDKINESEFGMLSTVQGGQQEEKRGFFSKVAGAIGLKPRESGRENDRITSEGSRDIRDFDPVLGEYVSDLPDMDDFDPMLGEYISDLPDMNDFDPAIGKHVSDLPDMDDFDPALGKHTSDLPDMDDFDPVLGEYISDLPDLDDLYF